MLIMKQMILPLSIIALVFAGCGESVPPTETVTADEGGGGEIPVDEAATEGANMRADANMADANGVAANTADAVAGMNDSAMPPANRAMPSGNEAASMTGPKKPATIKKTTSYRCDDKSVVKVDYMSDDLTAMVRTGTEAPVLLKTDKVGGAMTSEGGARLSGSGAEIVFKAADGKSLSCKG